MYCSIDRLIDLLQLRPEGNSPPRDFSETKVSLPKHAPVAMAFNEFFEKLHSKHPGKVPDKIVSAKPSFVDLDECGDDEPPRPPQSKLDRFINRFLGHAKSKNSTTPTNGPLTV